MALNNGKQSSIDNRRRMVAGMRLRHLTQREIATTLAEKGILNPETGEPYCLATINGDIKALRKQWQAEASRDTSELVAEVRAEMIEVRRRAWTAGELAIVLKALKQECDLLGLDAPTKIAPTDPTGTKEYAQLTDEERSARIDAILDEARARRDGSTADTTEDDPDSAPVPTAGEVPGVVPD